MVYEIVPLIDNGWSYHWDSNAFCPYLIKDDESKIITFEIQSLLDLSVNMLQTRILEGYDMALGYDIVNGGQELIQSIGENYLENDSEILTFSESISIKAYPNPFNSNCKIEFELPNDEFLNITYIRCAVNLLKPFSGKKSKGQHRYHWNVNNMIILVQEYFHIVKW